jgi:hypothetical protein
MPQAVIRSQLHKLNLAHEHRFHPRYSFILSAVSPWPHRPLLASGRFANGHSSIFSPRNRRQSCSLEAGVKPLRLRATYCSLFANNQTVLKDFACQHMRGPFT